MFRRYDVRLMSNPVCEKTVEDLQLGDFQYYDKDGFELNQAERKFYAAMGYPIDKPILNHHCWQETWFELEPDVEGLIVDHSMFLCRCSYTGAAAAQLSQLQKQTPLAGYLLRTKIKWGFDFALDAVRDGEVFEVLHIEHDHNDYQRFNERMLNFEWTVRHTDWQDAADRVWTQRDQWQHLKGFDQNHWKASYLLGWSKAEYTEKSV